MGAVAVRSRYLFVAAVAVVVTAACAPTPGGGGSGAPVITTTALTYGMVGLPYSVTLTATGTAPITWGTSGALPAGLTIDPPTGLVAGTPTAEGRSTVTVTATNSAGTTSKSLQLAVYTPLPTSQAPSGTGAAIAANSAILFTHFDSVSPGKGTHQYRANGSISDVGAIGGLTDAFLPWLGYNPAGTLRATAAGARVEVRQVPGNTLVATVPDHDVVNPVAHFSPDGAHLAVYSFDSSMGGEFQIYNTSTWTSERALTGLDQPGPFVNERIVWSKDSTRAAVSRYHYVGGLIPYVEQVQTYGVSAANDRFVASGCSVNGWSSTNRLALSCGQYVIGGFVSELRTAAPDGTAVRVVNRGSICNTITISCTATTGIVSGTAFSPDGSKIAGTWTAGAGGRMVVLNDAAASPTTFLTNIVTTGPSQFSQDSPSAWVSPELPHT